MTARTKAFVVVLLGILGFGLSRLYNESMEVTYQRETSQEVKAGHIAMTERLKSAQPGDFIVRNDGVIACVQGATEHGTIVPSRQPVENGWLNLVYKMGDHATRANVDLAGRGIKRVVTPNDPEWPEMAKKFLNVPQK